MPTTITTISVHPDRADALRDLRDKRGLGSMDAALAELIDEEH